MQNATGLHKSLRNRYTKTPVSTGLKGAAGTAGIMDYVTKNETGFIKGDDSSQYYFQKDQIIEADKGKPIQVGKKVRFYPTNLGESKMANNIEIL